MNTSLEFVLPRLGHVARRAELLRAGFDDRDIQRAVLGSSVFRVRNGFYADGGAHPDIVRAVRVGGVLAGSSAGAFYKIWTPHAFVLTVSVLPTAQRLRSPGDCNQPLCEGQVALFRDGHLLDRRRERLVVSPETVAVQALRYLEPRVALAVLDSTLRLPSRSRPMLTDINRRIPQRLLYLTRWADPRAESGTESALRHGLLSAGLEFEPQAWLTSTIRVDFLVAGFVVVECTSQEHHGSPEQYNSDRGRITALVSLGYLVLEFSYRQVFFEWAQVWAAILAALRLRPAILPRPARVHRSPQLSRLSPPSSPSLSPTSPL